MVTSSIYNSNTSESFYLSLLVIWHENVAFIDMSYMENNGWVTSALVRVGEAGWTGWYEWADWAGWRWVDTKIEYWILLIWIVSELAVSMRYYESYLTFIKCIQQIEWSANGGPDLWSLAHSCTLYTYNGNTNILYSMKSNGNNKNSSNNSTGSSSRSNIH